MQETNAPAITTSDAGPASSGAGAQSWLSELLARASVDDQLVPPTPPVEVGPSKKSETTISSAIGDAGRLVDETQLAKAWNDYRERQRDSFDRIYTDEGTKVLKEIRRQLSRDPNFAGSVAMYNEQFERLLLSVDDGSDDDDLLKFLTTDAGKTYTLLAHASGRLALPADEVMQS